MIPLTPLLARSQRSVALYEAARSNIHHAPKVVVPQGHLIYRAVGREKVHATPRGARTLNPNASWSESNRWDGRVATKVAQGALNTSTNLRSAANEAAFYARHQGEKYIIKGPNGNEVTIDVLSPAPKDLQSLMVKKRFFVYRLMHKVELVDLRPENDLTRSFLRRLEDDPKFRAAQKDLERAERFPRKPQLAEDVLAPDSGVYELTRPIGVAALQIPDTAGLCATAVRETLESNPHGQNFVLAGDDGIELGFLDPVYSVSAGVDQLGRPVVTYHEVEINDLASPYPPDTVIDLTHE